MGFDPSAEMAQAIWDRGSAADCVSREAEASQRVGPHETGAAADWAPRSRAPQLFRCFLKGIRGNDNDGRGGESRWLHQAYFAQRESPGRDGKICTIETIERDKIRPLKPSNMAGFVR